MSYELMIVVFAVIILTAVYLVLLNARLVAVPPEAEAVCAVPWTPQDVLDGVQVIKNNLTDFKSMLPEPTGRRYVIVGGSGSVGSWIVQHLLERGEDPAALRITDLRPPTRDAVKSQNISFIATDMSNADAVAKAFSAPWPKSVEHRPLTVYLIAAFIKPGDRKADFLAPYIRINVDGTRNVLAAAKSAGCSILIATSSSSVSMRPRSFFALPWGKFPKDGFQVCNDLSMESLDRPLSDFFGCYAYSKARAEKLVREADDPENGFRTGVIRPGHAIYGHGDENPMSLTWDYLRRGGSPTWLRYMVCPFVSAQNVSLAHQLFEARLLDPAGSKLGSRAYAITDPGPCMRYGNLYTFLQTLAHPATPIKFPIVPAVAFLLIAYVIEGYALLQHRYLRFLPRPQGDIETLQPAVLNVSTLHLIIDNKPIEQDLGYRSKLQTMEGFYLAIKDWNDRIEAKLALAKQSQGEVEPMQDKNVVDEKLPVVLPPNNLR